MLECPARVAVLLGEFGATRPYAEIVEQMNVWFHEYEAAGYDDEHDEIFDRLPQVWARLLDKAAEAVKSPSIRVLDFGCGTGFEASQLLSHPIVSRVEEVVCYDLSMHMLDECRERFSGDNRMRYVCRYDDLVSLESGFDLILTNSLLHHLPHPYQVISELTALTNPEAIWINGHEPSRRFFMNAECLKVYHKYSKFRRWSKKLSIVHSFVQLGKVFGITTTPYRQTARRAWREGLFKRHPTSRLVSEVVDLHVPRNTRDIEDGRGFDPAELAQRLDGMWRLQYTETYNFMGPIYDQSIPAIWQEQSDRLRSKYPEDGAVFSAMWKHCRAA